MQTTSYTIPSSGRTGVYHTLTVFADGFTDCSCEDATYRRRQCKHGRQYVAGAIPTTWTKLPDLERTQELAERNAAAADLSDLNRLLGRW